MEKLYTISWRLYTSSIQHLKLIVAQIRRRERGRRLSADAPHQSDSNRRQTGAPGPIPAAWRPGSAAHLGKSGRPQANQAPPRAGGRVSSAPAGSVARAPQSPAPQAVAGKSAPAARAGAPQRPAATAPRLSRAASGSRAAALTCSALRRRRRPLSAPGARSADQAAATFQLRRPHPRLSQSPTACPARRYTSPPPTAMASSAAAVPTDGARARRRRARARARSPSLPTSQQPSPRPVRRSGQSPICGPGRAAPVPAGRRVRRNPRLFLHGCLPCGGGALWQFSLRLWEDLGSGIPSKLLSGETQHLPRPSKLPPRDSSVPTFTCRLSLVNRWPQFCDFEPIARFLEPLRGLYFLSPLKLDGILTAEWRHEACFGQ
ncbi:translation initiation factor IF-2-like [Bubalus bubalis]|uniref:translation initiation factor IF-2-like n=1 Tax=Bubalus bubalis TaxID=89462 RepID=UPI001D12FD78|nr:translation initiation factor IF-2-like [Bubalus bubalis]